MTTTTPLTFHVCETALGWVGIVLSPAGLRATTLPRRTRDEALREALDMGATGPADPTAAAPVAERLSALVSGAAAAFGAPIDWSGITPFRRAVLEETMRIPAGETRSYGWLAERAGNPRAARAVGRVMATNPLPLVIPCHRVIDSRGALHGYGGGLPMKEALLRAEGAIP